VTNEVSEDHDWHLIGRRTAGASDSNTETVSHVTAGAHLVLAPSRGNPRDHQSSRARQM
jgi:hypothetical protein